MKLLIKREDFYDICQLLFDNDYRIDENIVFRKQLVRSFSFDILQEMKEQKDDQIDKLQHELNDMGEKRTKNKNK